MWRVEIGGWEGWLGRVIVILLEICEKRNVYLSLSCSFFYVLLCKMDPYAVSMMLGNSVATHISLLHVHMVVQPRTPFLSFIASWCIHVGCFVCLFYMMVAVRWLNYHVYYIARMYEPIHNNIKAPIEDTMDQDQGSGKRASYNLPPNLSGMPSILPELAGNIGNPNY